MARIPPTAWVTAERIFAQVFGLFVFAVQAPMLGPHAFGLVAAVMVFVGFWESVPGAAATDALISIREIDDTHFNSVTLGSALLGLVIGAGLFGFAGPLSAAMGDQELVPVMRTMAALPFLQALSIAPTAAAQRDLLFRSITLRTTVSLLAGGVVGLVLAVQGAGVWALVWQALVQRAVAAIVLWLAVPTSFSIRLSAPHLRELAAFALPNMVSRVMSWASGQIPRLILGFYLGPTGLGLFTLATRLNDIVTQVAILPKAIVARIDLRRFAGDVPALGAAVRRVVLHISVITFPLCVGGAVVAAPLIDAWLDPRWHHAIVPSQLMLLVGVPYVTIYVSASLLLALNRQNTEAVICTVQSIGTVAAVAVTASFGTVPAVVAILVLALLTAPATVVVMSRQCGVTLRDTVWPQIPACLAACLMGAAVYVLRKPFEAKFGIRIGLLLEVLSGVVVYGALLAAMMAGISGGRGPRRSPTAKQELLF